MRQGKREGITIWKLNICTLWPWPQCFMRKSYEKNPKHKPIACLKRDPRVQATTTLKQHSLRRIYIFGHMTLAT